MTTSLCNDDGPRVELLFEDLADERSRPLHEEVFRLAQSGSEDPLRLSPDEIKRVCFALVLHFHQLGFGSR